MAGIEVEINAIDRTMMARCIELSKTGAACGELPFGSLVARHGQIIAEATNQIMCPVDEPFNAPVYFGIFATTKAEQGAIAANAVSSLDLYASGPKELRLDPER